MDARARAAASIEEARSELDRALAEIDMIQTFNPMLIGLVAHSLSNYISVTAASAEMLQLTLRDSKDPDVPIWIDGIRHTADLMQHSVGRLVSMSALGDFPLKLDWINLPVLMERACEYFRCRAASAGVHVTCAAIGAVPLAWGDRVALAVVAHNLLSNAVRVSNGNGPVRVQITTEPGHVVCSVRDSGPGLAKDEQKRLFAAPLPQAAAPGGAPQHGHGLAITREFLRRMDGELWCESEPGRGACFAFRLPAIE